MAIIRRRITRGTAGTRRVELLTIAKTSLETIAEETWQRLKDAARHGVQFGEETVTNLALLNIKRKGDHRMVFVQTPKTNHALENKGQTTV